MRIKQLTLSHVKQVESLKINFPSVARAGTPAERMPWTVILGEGGTCKTTILQAVALAATVDQSNLISGSPTKTAIGRITLLVQDGADVATASATFTRTNLPDVTSVLRSTVSLDNYGTVHASSDVTSRTDGDQVDDTFGNHLVAAYGVNRTLLVAGKRPSFVTTSDRLRPLFDDVPVMVGPMFFRYFEDGREEVMIRMVNRVLATGLLPNLLEVVPRGGGYVLARQRVGSRTVDVPLSLLPSSYQSTLSWVIDLVGHALDLSDGSLEDTREIVGLVLVDGIDACVHPALQVGLIRGLMAAFPKVQFVVTASSPLVLAAMRPDEDLVVRLGIDEQSGMVVRHDVRMGRTQDPDARLMTVSEVLERYFGRESAFVGIEGEWLAERQSLAYNPYRSDDEDERLQVLTSNLTDAGVRVRPAVSRV